MKNRRHNFNINKSVTIIELIVVLVLLSIIVISIASVNTFNHHKFITTQRRIGVQNDVSYILDHMAKNIARAIGANQTDAIVISNNNNTISVVVDYNLNGIRDVGGAAQDKNITYSFNNNTKSISFQNLNDGAQNTTFTNITNCVFRLNEDKDVVEVDLRKCFDTSASATETPENPCIGLKTRIQTPLVSEN